MHIYNTNSEHTKNSKEYLRKIQIIFMLLESAFRQLFFLKFSFKLVTFSKSYAIKEVIMPHRVEV